MRQRAFDSGRDDAAETHRRLIEVATDVFAERGFGEARIREIAKRASVNVAMIGYHFQNKEGLYAAVIGDISAKMTVPLDGALTAARTALADPQSRRAGWDDIAIELLVALYRVMLEEGVGNWSRIMLREQMDPSPAFDDLHGRVAAPFIATLADVLQRRDEEKGASRERALHMVKAVMLMGQLLVFTSAKASVERVLGPGDMATIEQIIRSAPID